MKKRLLKIPKNQSFFLFGARSTGKSTLIKHVFKEQPHLYIDLLDIQQESKYLKEPQMLKAEILALPKKINLIIDYPT